MREISQMSGETSEDDDKNIIWSLLMVKRDSPIQSTSYIPKHAYFNL